MKWNQRTSLAVAVAAFALTTLPAAAAPVRFGLGSLHPMTTSAPCQVMRQEIASLQARSGGAISIAKTLSGDVTNGSYSAAVGDMGLVVQNGDAFVAAAFEFDGAAFGAGATSGATNGGGLSLDERTLSANQTLLSAALPRTMAGSSIVQFATSSTWYPLVSLTTTAAQGMNHSFQLRASYFQKVCPV